MRVAATEAEVQKATLELLAVKGIFAFRLNSAAFKVEGRFFKAHSLGPGASDILVLPTVDSKILIPTWIELKSQNGRQSRLQAEFQAFVESKGHSYLLARSVDDVALWLKERGL